MNLTKELNNSLVESLDSLHQARKDFYPGIELGDTTNDGDIISLAILKIGSDICEVLREVDDTLIQIRNNTNKENI